jgi:peptide/nickel transport system permease protein
LIFAPIAALFQGRAFDRGVSMVSFALVSVPTFVSAIVLIQIFAVRLGVLPSTGFRPISEGILVNLKSVLLPSMALAAAEAGIFTRVLRAGMVASLEEDYTMMARAKGLSTRVVVSRHALRPASLPLLTLIGLSTGALIGGAVITETIFALPGIGRLVIDSINTRDLITVQGTVALVAVSYVIINYLVDIAYLIADPRIRHGKS